MSYKKPKCDCGTDLVFRTDEVAEYEYRIRKDGRLSKRGKRVSMIEQQNYGYLFCLNCNNRYEYNFDFKGEEAFKYKREGLL